MKPRINLGNVVAVDEVIGCRVYRKFGGYTVDVRQMSIDLSANAPDQILAEAGQMPKINLARAASKYMDVESSMALYLVGPVAGFPVKIGIADDPHTRLKSLQTGNAEELACHAVFWAKGGDAYGTEQRVLANAKASGLHERGEWLAVTPSTAVDLVMEAAQQEKARLCTSAMMVENVGRMMQARDMLVAEQPNMMAY